MTALWSAGIGYLFGSIPFGLLLARIGGLGDIRRIGSGNIGATNVLRTGRKGLALLTLLLDGAKGAASIALVVWLWGAQQVPMMLAGGGAILGHLFPAWLKFKGGKGVATGLGVALALSPAVGISMCLTWLVIAAVFRYSSLAALAAFLMGPVYTAKWGTPALGGFLLIVALVIAVRHAGNIRRLLRGEEPKIGGTAGSQDVQKGAV